MNDQLNTLILTYKKVFSGEDGKRVLEDLERQLFANGQTFVPGSPDVSAFNAGMREAYLRIVRRIEYDLDAKPPVAVNKENL